MTTAKLTTNCPSSGKNLTGWPNARERARKRVLSTTMGNEPSAGRCAVSQLNDVTPHFSLSVGNLFLPENPLRLLDSLRSGKVPLPSEGRKVNSD